MNAADPRGAGDSQTAGMTARIAAEDDWETVLRVGAATVEVLAERVELAVVP